MQMQMQMQKQKNLMNSESETELMYRNMFCLAKVISKESLNYSYCHRFQREKKGRCQLKKVIIITQSHHVKRKQNLDKQREGNQTFYKLRLL